MKLVRHDRIDNGTPQQNKKPIMKTTNNTKCLVHTQDNNTLPNQYKNNLTPMTHFLSILNQYNKKES